MNEYKITTIDGIWTVLAASFRDALDMVNGFYVPISATRVKS